MPNVRHRAGEGALRAPFEPRPPAAQVAPRRRATGRVIPSASAAASEAGSLHAGPRQRLRRPPLRSGPSGDADRRSGILACTAGLRPASGSSLRP